MPKRPRTEIARAVLRLANESLQPVAVLADEARVDMRSLIRWITQGRGGVHLAGVHRPGVGWLTSAAALRRFNADSREPGARSS